MIARRLIRIDEYIEDLERFKFEHDNFVECGFTNEKKNPYVPMLAEAFLKQKQGYDFVFYNNVYGVQDVNFIKPVCDYIKKQYIVKAKNNSKVFFQGFYEHDIEFLADFFKNKNESILLLLPIEDYFHFFLSRQEKNNFEAGLNEKIKEIDSFMIKNASFILYDTFADVHLVLNSSFLENIIDEMILDEEVKSFLNIESLMVKRFDQNPMLQLG